MSLFSQRVAELPKDVKGIVYGFGPAGVLGVVITPQSERPRESVFLNHRLYGYRSNGVPVYEGTPRDGAGTKKEKFILPNAHHPPQLKPELT